MWAVFHFFDQTDEVLPAPSGQVLGWFIRTGRAGEPLKIAGKPVTVRFQVEMGDAAPPLFQKGFFARMGCVAEVAKP